MKRIIITVLVLLFFFSSHPAYAKILPRFKGVSAKGGSRGIGASARLRQDRQALIVSFSNLRKAKSVSYILSYRTNGKDEGVAGEIDSSAGDSTSRELLFGTCSTGVCTYHTNIANMKLEVTSSLVSGKTTIKRFRIKV